MWPPADSLISAYRILGQLFSPNLIIISTTTGLTLCTIMFDLLESPNSFRMDRIPAQPHHHHNHYQQHDHFQEETALPSMQCPPSPSPSTVSSNLSASTNARSSSGTKLTIKRTKSTVRSSPSSGALNRESYIRMMNSFQRKHNLQSRMVKHMLLCTIVVVALFVMSILFTVIYVRYLTIRELSAQQNGSLCGAGGDGGSSTTVQLTNVTSVTRIPAEHSIIFNSTTIHIVENVAINIDSSNRSVNSSVTRHTTEPTHGASTEEDYYEGNDDDDIEEDSTTITTVPVKKKKGKIVLRTSTTTTMATTTAEVTTTDASTALTEVETLKSDSSMKERQDFVKLMTLEAWTSYRKYAWGQETVEPVSEQPFNYMFGRDTGHTIVTSLSTLWVMELRKEYDLARAWVKLHFSLKHFNQDSYVFPLVIGYVGGLLSSYALTGDEMYLNKVSRFAIGLKSAYNDDKGLSKETVNIFANCSTSNPNAFLLEVASQMMEYNYLASLSNSSEFANRSRSIESFLSSVHKPNGLYMDILNVNTGQWSGEAQLLGADSTFYAHLIKRYIQSGGRDVQFMHLFQDAVQHLERSAMFAQDVKTGALHARGYLLDYRPQDYEYMKFAGCQLGATLALAAQEMERDLSKMKSSEGPSVGRAEIRKLQYRISRYWEVAEEIAETCYQESVRSKTGLPPRRFYFNLNQPEVNLTYIWKQEPTFRKHILSSELAESYFVLWRTTHDPKYREYAWQLTQAIHANCRTKSGGYSSIENVNELPAKMVDYQLANFISGTLKYLYLTFSEDTLLPLDQWVFNEIGQPLPIIR